MEDEAKSKNISLRHILEGAAGAVVFSVAALYGLGTLASHSQLNRVNKDCLRSGANQAFCGCVRSEVAAHLPQSKFSYSMKRLGLSFYEEQDKVKVAAYQSCTVGTSGGVHHSF